MHAKDVVFLAVATHPTLRLPVNRRTALLMERHLLKRCQRRRWLPRPPQPLPRQQRQQSWAWACRTKDVLNNNSSIHKWPWMSTWSTAITSMDLITRYATPVVAGFFFFPPTLSRRFYIACFFVEILRKQVVFKV